MQTETPGQLILKRSVAVWCATLLATGVAVAQFNNNGAEVLTRGAVHEAFANLSESETSAGIVYSRNPPDDIEELPPDQRPEGDNVAWIPGYWSWDDDREDYIWLSGVWRDLPPGRQWVPGYWSSVRGGSQFVSGFWADVSRNEIEYLPQPPTPLEVGPSSPPLSRNHNWAPGSWVWVDTRYAWQPGYWVPMQQDWVWTPAHYVWTPRGYVYVSGYWDHDIVNRGVMFAPVYYSTPVYRQSNYRYSPRIVIDISIVLGHFFIQRDSHHYYYGDYYDRRHRDRGYEPWYTRHDRYNDRDRRDGRGGRDGRDRYYREDPLYASYRSQQINRDPDWDRHVEEQYTYRREHTEARPPRTFAQQSKQPSLDGKRGAIREDIIIAKPLDQVVKNQSQRNRFAPVDSQRRNEIETRSRDVKQYRAERKQIELEQTTAEVARNAQPVRTSPPRAITPQERNTRSTQTEGTPKQPQPDRSVNSRGQTVQEPKPTRSAEARPPVRETEKRGERTQPERKALRESPIVSKQADTVKRPPPAPNIPKPDARTAEPSVNRRSSSGSDKEKSRGRDTKPAQQDTAEANDSKDSR